MAYVVTDACVRCKYTDCVEVCPVDCFREGENMLVIDPDECIDCGACVPACPVSAIYLGEDVPEKWSAYAELNARLAKGWPMINKKRDPQADHEQWKAVEGKIAQVSERPGKGT
ncbi:MAG: ferredoxin FdxA [Myxococcota bacterium]